MIDLAIDLFVQLIEYCVPVAIVFEFGNLLVGMVLRAAFGGKLWLGR